MKDGWKEGQIGKLCDVIAGQSPAGKYYNQNAEGLPFYQGKKNFGDQYLGKPSKWTTQTTKEAFAGDILMSVRAPVGPVNFSTDHICIGRGLAAIRTNEKLNKNFLFYYLRLIEKDIAGNEGAVFPSINKSQIEALPIPLPPLEEQKRIVAILDEAFEGIDRAKQNAEKNLANAKELFPSLKQRIFYSEGNAWPMVSLANSCEFFNGKAHEKCIDENGRYVVINSKYISSEGAVAKRSDNQLFPLRKDDIVFVMSDVPKGKALAKCFLVDADGKYSLNQRICAIRSDKFVTKYLFHHLNRHMYLLEFDNGENQTNLRKGDILDCPLFTPPIPIQEEVAEQLDEVEFAARSLAACISRKIDCMIELKQSILQKAFAGELS
ncbi:MAG: putative type I site-specific deoxyribonuclease [Nitrospirales bacterium]|nr:MAG: putative type I site-specific deoxyribonuclease [Nitrospirales bacterium]